MNNWEAIIQRLRSDGWTVRWFPYVDRSGRSVWRASAAKPHQPAVTIEADFLPEAVVGLEAACRELASGLK